MRLLTLPCLSAALLLAGCAANTPRAAEAPAIAAEPTLAVAQLLAAAETAASSDKPRLARTLAALEGLGAHPAESSVDPVPGWYALIPPSDMPPPVRGRMLGPAYQRGTLEPGASVTLDQLFDGGRQARVAIAAPRAAPVGLAVLDGAGKAVCADRAAHQCNWVPPFSARHQIVISNAGPARAAYYLVID